MDQDVFTYQSKVHIYHAEEEGVNNERGLAPSVAEIAE